MILGTNQLSRKIADIRRLDMLLKTGGYYSEYDIGMFDCSNMSNILYHQLKQWGYDNVGIGIKKINNIIHSFVYVVVPSGTIVIETTNDPLHRLGLIVLPQSIFLSIQMGMVGQLPFGVVDPYIYLGATLYDKPSEIPFHPIEGFSDELSDVGATMQHRPGSQNNTIGQQHND